MIDHSEHARRALVQEINTTPAQDIPGPTWDQGALRREFDVLGFTAPLVAVRRKADGVLGTMMFKHMPRIYSDFQADNA